MNEIEVYTSISTVPRLSIRTVTREKYQLIHRVGVIITYQAAKIAEGKEGGPNTGSTTRMPSFVTRLT